MGSEIRKQIRTWRRGQATVEFALSALILLFVLFGIIEVARVVLTSSDINNAAREGAHYLALNPRADQYDVIGQMQSTLVLVNRSSLTLSTVNVQCDSCRRTDDCAQTSAPTPCVDYSYQPVTVAVTYTWSSLVPLPGLASGVTLSGRSTALREH